MSMDNTEKLAEARASDLVKAFLTHGFAQSDFLTQEEQAWMRRAFDRLALRRCFSYAFYGGAVGCERAMAVVCENEADVARRSGVTFLRILPRGGTELSHREVLGSLLGLGVSRSAIGDIFPAPDGAGMAAAVTGRIADYILENLSRVGRECVDVVLWTPPEGFAIERKTEEMIVNTASLRLDGVVAALCRESRADAAARIREGLVQVDHEVCLRPDRKLNGGETLSLRKVGKFILTTDVRTTRSGRLAVKVLRYI